MEAAVGLFDMKGYAETTVDQIAERAGVSARTFFRHFPDKEEVLFADDDRLLPTITAGITASTDPVDAQTLMTDVLGKLADLLESDRSRLQQRQRVIDSQVALTGRELAKQARWQAKIAAALIERGFQSDASDLLAAIGLALFRRSLHAWLADAASASLRQRVATALPGVRVILDEVSTSQAGDTSLGPGTPSLAAHGQRPRPGP
ncbi:helix-turn-helix domain-containing protein [Intrasporangium sp. DVR]|uniref:TetR/AcrR family transcriptional regulator n=1 Tax=Intrasporangium sp. DVR TaxID=3127867 RepID=UPI00313A5C67